MLSRVVFACLLGLMLSATLASAECAWVLLWQSGDEPADYSYAFAFLRVLAAPALLLLFFSALLFLFTSLPWARL